MAVVVSGMVDDVDAVLSCDSLTQHRLQQRHALGGDGLLAADGADAFAGLGLEADALGLDAEDVGQPLADGLAVGESLGRWAKTMQSMLTICQPKAAHGARAPRRAFRPNRGRGSRDRCRETSGRCRPARPRPAGRRSRRATARRHRCGRPTPDRGECRFRPSRSGPPGRSRCVSCPIPTRIPSVARSPLAVDRPLRPRGGLYRNEGGRRKAERSDEG